HRRRADRPGGRWPRDGRLRRRAGAGPAPSRTGGRRRAARDAVRRGPRDPRPEESPPMSTAVLPYPRTATSSPLAQLQRFWRTPKGLLTLVFLPLLVVGAQAVGWRLALSHVLSAVAGACLVELVATRIERGAWRWPSSALLSGLIVAFVLEPQQPWSVTLAVGALVALVSCLTQLAGAGQAYLLLGILVGNLALAARRWLGSLSYRRDARRSYASDAETLETRP